MYILAIKTDSDKSEIYLCNDKVHIDKYIWEAGRALAKDLHDKIKKLLMKNNLSINDINAYCAYSGPGSFTGLRIGISTLNALAYVNDKPIVGSDHVEWLGECIDRLLNGENDKVLIPKYGSDANITVPKK